MCTLKDLQSAMRHFTGGAYAPNEHFPGWADLVSALNRLEADPFDFCYFIVCVLCLDNGSAQLRLCNFLKSSSVLDKFHQWLTDREDQTAAVVRSNRFRLDSMIHQGLDMSAVLLDEGLDISPFVRCEYALTCLKEPEPVITKFKSAVAFLMKGCSVYLKFCPKLSAVMGDKV